MRCNKCGAMMIQNIGGNYYCPECSNYVVNPNLIATRKCSLCNTVEFQSTIIKDEFWICDDCLGRLKELVNNYSDINDNDKE